MNNKELNFTTAMPVMKKSLLALAVAGTLAASGVSNATLVSSEYLTISGTSATVEGDMTGTSPGTVTIDASGAATLTSTNGSVAVDTITISEISGTSAIGFTTEDTTATNGLEVTTGGNWGSSNISTGTITLTGNAHATASGVTTLTVANGHTIYGAIIAAAGASDTATSNPTIIIADGGAVSGNITLNGDNTDLTDAALTIGTSGGANGATVTGNVTGGADGEGVITVAGTATITGNIGIGATAGTTALATVTVNDGQALTVTGTVNADLANLGNSSGTGTNTVTFKGATVVLADMALGSNDATSTNVVNFDSSDNAITATIALSTGDDDSDDTNTINIIGSASNTVTYASAIATADKIDNLNTGSATQAGKSLFSSAVDVTNISVLGGDIAAEDSSAVFVGAVGGNAAITAVNITASDTADATAEFQNALTATAVTLNDGTSGNATLIINTTSGAQTIAGTIDAAAAGEGVLNIYDDDNGEEHLATFSGDIGATVRVNAINIGTTAYAGAADFNGDVTAGTVTLAGSILATEVTTLVADAAKAVDVTKLVVTGGTAVDATGDAGSSSATFSGTLAVGSGGIDVNGGAGDVDEDGGAAKVTLSKATTTLAGPVTIDGGASGAAATSAAGGAAELEATLALSATGAFTVTGGTGAGGAGAGNGGVATLDTNAAFTTTSTVTFAGGAGGAGTTDAADGGAATGEFATTIDVLGLTLNGGAGGAGAVSVGGAATATVTGASTIGASGINMTAGAGGAFGGAAVGGASTLKLTGASTITGDINITGGAGHDHDDADGGAASATFTGAVTATAQTLTITGGAGDTADAGDDNGDGGAASATFTANATFSSIVLDNGAAGEATGGIATLTSDAAAANTITGAITAAADGEGAISVATDDAATTFASNIGTSATRIATLNVTSAANKASTGNFNGDVYVDAITLTANATSGAAGALFAKDVGFTTLTLDKVTEEATATFDGTTAQTVTGSIVGAASNDGAIVVSNTGGTVTFASALGSGDSNELGSVTLNSSTTTVFDSTVEAATLSASGAMTLKGAATLSSTLTTANGSTITLGSAFKNGGAVAITAATSVGTLNQTAGAVTVNLSNQFTSGSVTLLDNNATLDATDLAAFTVTDTALVDYSIALGQTDAANDSLIVSATKRTTAGIASNLGMSTAQTAALGQVTDALASGDAAASTAIDSVLVSGGTAAVNAVEQLNPDAGAAHGAALAAVGGVNNVISGRQSATRVAFNTLGNQSGISTGDDANDAVVWAQIFGSSATQDKVGTIDGYDADSQGLALGWETDKSGDLMGLSVSYSDADVDGKSASASHTDTTAVQVSAYGTYGKATDWMVGYASGDNDTKRTVNFGGLNLTASGKYDSSIFTAKVGHAFASSNTGEWTMTPKVDATYTNIDNDGYTETGANNLNLIVASSSNDILTARAGAEFTQRIVDGDSVTIPHINIMAGYDLKNDGASTSATFTGGGSAFTTKGADPEKASVQLGFGVDHVSDDSTVSLDLNADLRSDYDNMSGSLTFKSKF